MTPGGELKALLGSAAGRSAVYALLARCFRHPAQVEQHPLPAPAFEAAFEPAISEHACSLRAGAYWAHEQSTLFEELVRFYEHFGLARAEHAELPDHLSVQFQFMHYLAHLEDEARADRAAIDALTRAQRDFLERQLRRLVYAVHGALKSGDAGCRELVALAVSCVDAEIARTSRAARRNPDIPSTT
ncbi:MAG: molecular chaperone TorD family protein [Gammaproteobacteria bacterium]|nr:molecular chaperone TorD family protein [Gammaproteobacteria bacterium]MBI5619274.1 molecular chaperone TorD family protein [Gammaproteobacteria bacterium]